jgi:TolA protein
VTDAGKPQATAKADGAALAKTPPPGGAARPPAKEPGSGTGAGGGDGDDAYAAAARRWGARERGTGLGGTEGKSGPAGTGGGDGAGTPVGFEFLAYRQQVIQIVKDQWTTALRAPSLVASVRFRIDPQGNLSDVRIEQASGNAAYDLSALRAVERASPLPPPPSRYADQFADFVIEFRSEEQGDQAG